MADLRDVIVGIDLGTTNSLVAFCDQSGPRVLVEDGGRAMVPSVVRFGAGEPLVGDEARRGAAQFAGATISSVKRLMGRSIADAGADLPYLPFRVVAGASDTARIELPGGKVVSPQEVSGVILRSLKGRAERVLGIPVTKAVVTVPAYFDDAQRQATRDAGRLAGLDVVRIVNEPTAAALAYGLGTSRLAGAKTRVVAVFDLGGGTFDVSILRLTPAKEADATAFFQVLSTAGDTHLGGDDVDQLLVGLFAGELATLGMGKPDAALVARLRAEGERVKIALSEVEGVEAVVALPPPHAEYRRMVTREDFERLISPLVDRTIDACGRAVRDARLGDTPIDAVVLVGGMTRTPLVRRRVGEAFGLTPYTAINPDEAVALGAAVQASLLSGTSRGSLLLDVIPLSLGIESANGTASKIVMRNTTVPTRAREMFSTQVDGQTSIKINVLQGEREMAADCRSLGVFHLRGIPPMPAGVPQLEVEFLVDASGVLQVSASERRSGKRAELQVVPNHGLTRDEVDRMERESLVHAREDMSHHRVADLVTNSTLDLKWITERLERHRGSLEGAYAASLDAAIAQLRELVERARGDWRSVDADAFYRTKESLDRLSLRLQEISITESLKSSGPAR
ncbi:MAG: Hsp70 family protein [Planctomycetota bacterium]